MALHGKPLHAVEGKNDGVPIPGYMGTMYGIPPTDEAGQVDNAKYHQQQRDILSQRYPGAIFS